MTWLQKRPRSTCSCFGIRLFHPAEELEDDFGNWKYYCEDGHRAVSELVTINGNTYYFNYNGEMTQGGSAGNDLFDESGIQIKNAGWNQTGGRWYYMDSSGAMQTGWIKDSSGSWYYLDTSGAMLTNTNIGGYTLGYDGRMQ